MKRKYVDLLIYVSLAFLVYTLIKKKYLTLPAIENWGNLFFSIILLFGFFLSSALLWHKILEKYKIPIKLPISLSSTGLSIFGKYIPAKIWGFIGQAVYVSNYTGTPIKQLAAISLENLVMHMWTGLIFGMIGVFLVSGIQIYGWLILIFWIPLTILMFSKVVHKLAEWLIKLIFKKEISIPWLDVKSKMAIMPWFILNLFFLAGGFYFFASSLSVSKISFSVGLGFPFAGILGILAFFAPGGLGIREGILVGYLKLAGFPTDQAVTISVASRLWVLVGEAFIFAVGFIVDKRKKTKKETANKKYI